MMDATIMDICLCKLKTKFPYFLRILFLLPKKEQYLIFFRIADPISYQQ